MHYQPKDHIQTHVGWCIYALDLRWSVRRFGHLFAAAFKSTESNEDSLLNQMIIVWQRFLWSFWITIVWSQCDTLHQASLHCNPAGKIVSVYSNMKCTILKTFFKPQTTSMRWKLWISSISFIYLEYPNRTFVRVCVFFRCFHHS